MVPEYQDPCALSAAAPLPFFAALSRELSSSDACVRSLAKKKYLAATRRRGGKEKNKAISSDRPRQAAGSVQKCPPMHVPAFATIRQLLARSLRIDVRNSGAQCSSFSMITRRSHGYRDRQCEKPMPRCAHAKKTDMAAHRSDIRDRTASLQRASSLAAATLGARAACPGKLIRRRFRSIDRKTSPECGSYLLHCRNSRGGKSLAHVGVFGSSDESLDR